MKRILVLLSFISAPALGQLYVAEAPLPAIENDGFYNIPLPPQITSLMMDDFRNIRILDEGGKEVPYITKVEHSERAETGLVEYRMEKEVRKGCCTMLTFQNVWKPINDVVLTIRNAEVTKDATLQGSDDKQNWFVIREKFRLVSRDGYASNSSTVQVSLQFPLSKYDYYRLTIDDSTAAPLNVVSAGYYARVINYGAYSELPAAAVSSADSADHSTWTVIRFDTTHFVNKLEFGISGPALYKRSATLFTREIIRTKKTTREYYSPIESFYITSRGPAIVLTGLKTRELYLQVFNENNPPLGITDVKAWQLNRSVIAWLGAGHRYKVAVGSDSLQVPAYDLEFFRDSIPSGPEVLKPGEIRLLYRPSQASTPTFFTDRNIIWVAIVLVVAILGTMSVRMIRENDKRKDSH